MGAELSCHVCHVYCPVQPIYRYRLCQ